MKLHNRKALEAFTQAHPDAVTQINAWIAEVETAEWKNPHELKDRYPKASVVGDQQTVFNINGNKYRILTVINYQHGIVLVKQAGTHQEYDKWRIK